MWTAISGVVSIRSQSPNKCYMFSVSSTSYQCQTALTYDLHPVDTTGAVILPTIHDYDQTMQCTCNG